MSASRRASGPSNASRRTCVAVSGRRSKVKEMAGVARGARTGTGSRSIRSRSAGQVGQPQGLAGGRVHRCRLVPDEVGYALAAIGRQHQLGRALGVLADAGEGLSEAGEACRETQDPVAVALAKGPRDALPDAHCEALRGVVEQAREQEIRVAVPGGAQDGHDVEAVAPVGRVHRLEERHLRRRQPAGQRDPFRRGDATGEVADELAGLTRPPRAHSGRPARSSKIAPAIGTMTRPPPKKRIPSSRKMPYCSTRRSRYAVYGLTSPLSTVQPSSGGMGSRLNTKRKMLIRTKKSSTRNASTSRSLLAITSCMAGEASMTRMEIAAAAAMIRLEAGPASATIASPRWPRERLGGVAGGRV